LAQSNDILKAKFNAVYREALSVQGVSESRIIGRANALIQSYNGLLRESKQTRASELSAFQELAEVPRRLHPNNITMAYERAGQVPANISQAMVTLGFPVPEVTPSAKALSTPPVAPVIQLNVTQQVNQLTTINFNQLIEMIQQQQDCPEATRQEATRAVTEFGDEISKPNPQPTKLRSCIDTVAKVGKAFVIPLLFKILENWDKIFPH
jgi:hypothetical protein